MIFLWKLYSPNNLSKKKKPPKFYLSHTPGLHFTYISAILIDVILHQPFQIPSGDIVADPWFTFHRFHSVPLRIYYKTEYYITAYYVTEY